MAKVQTGKSNRKMSDMKFKDLQKLLEINGYELMKTVNSTHAKFYNSSKNHSVVVSGNKGGTGGSKVHFPIVQKTLKACGIEWR